MFRFEKVVTVAGVRSRVSVFFRLCCQVARLAQAITFSHYLSSDTNKHAQKKRTQRAVPEAFFSSQSGGFNYKCIKVATETENTVWITLEQRYSSRLHSMCLGTGVLAPDKVGDMTKHELANACGADLKANRPYLVISVTEEEDLPMNTS